MLKRNFIIKVEIDLWHQCIGVTRWNSGTRYYALWHLYPAKFWHFNWYVMQLFHTAYKNGLILSYDKELYFPLIIILNVADGKRII